MSEAANNFTDTEWIGNKVIREANDYLYAQRSMRHKVSIHYNQMENLFIRESITGEFTDSDDFIENKFEDYENKPANSNNATNLNQLYSEETYNKNITQEKYYILDGRTAFESVVNGQIQRPKLLSRDNNGNTVEIIGWMSRVMCDSNGYFEKPIRLVYRFKNDHSIIKWMIRSVSNEVPVDFSVCAYDAAKNIIYKSKVYKDNASNRIELDINRGRCQYIELRISRWGIKDEGNDKGLRFEPASAKIVYFYHHASFPKGITDYKSNDLLQSFSVSEYLCSSIGKANYGVQSNTGQFTLINVNKLFDSLKSAGYLKNGLKVQYYVAVNKYYQPKVDSDGNVDESADENGNYTVEPPPSLNAGEIVDENSSSNVIEVEDDATALSLEQDNGEWKLLATQYITDIEFDEVKNIVKFKTQDRMIKFKDNTYPGYKKVTGSTLSAIRNCDLLEDILKRALQKPIEKSASAGNAWEKYKITDEVREGVKNRVIVQGYLDEMNTWSALQKACDADLIHIYIDREDVLVVDKIDQL